jgi:hypothetical protein
MVRKQKKYKWQNRKERFRILNGRKELAKAINNTIFNTPITYPLLSLGRVATPLE